MSQAIAALRERFAKIKKSFDNTTTITSCRIMAGNPLKLAGVLRIADSKIQFFAITFI